MTTYGDTAYLVRISTAQAGSPAAPSGDIVYLIASKVSGNDAFKMKIKNIPGGMSYSNKDGKRECMVRLSDCIVTKFGAHTTNTLLMNAIKQFFQTQHKIGGSPLYLWVYNNVDSDYVALGQNAAVSAFTDYLKGYITSVDWEMVGSVYYFRSINFVECLI